ncbi:hypothetical protein CPLU01_00070 [Colletotrichum plurivorum]|uniref:Uncharacterized protein n=1 Tax=Colletotrichum plurivorum TaxID=2175906 RepID=A0A8H6NSU7_9PEZI|nr:hypothetical protein CPLU01_00070 [Colletotrichum plurivorum]
MRVLCAGAATAPAIGNCVLGIQPSTVDPSPGVPTAAVYHNLAEDALLSRVGPPSARRMGGKGVRLRLRTLRLHEIDTEGIQ